MTEHHARQLVNMPEWVNRAPRCAVIKGELLPGVYPRWCRRLSDHVEHRDAVTFGSYARLWVGIDVDGLEEPHGCTYAAEPEDSIEHAILRLPTPYHDAHCWWQATGSAGQVRHPMPAIVLAQPPAELAFAALFNRAVLRRFRAELAAAVPDMTRLHASAEPIVNPSRGVKV